MLALSICGGHASYAADAIIFADFEGDTYGKWQAAGPNTQSGGSERLELSGWDAGEFAGEAAVKSLTLYELKSAW